MKLLVKISAVVGLEVLGEGGVVEDGLEDVGVGVHAAEDDAHELRGEDDHEVLEGVGSGGVDEVGIGGPVALELLEQQGVGDGELVAVLLVEAVNDR